MTEGGRERKEGRKGKREGRKGKKEGKKASGPMEKKHWYLYVESKG